MKRTTYLLDFYHFGDEDVKEEHAKIVRAIQELVPHAEVFADPVKTDMWQLQIEIEVDA